MVRLILGRAKTGKTERLLEQVRREGPARPQVILVPEQISHEMERRLCQVCGAQASRYGEVLSFTRLANRVFTVAGGLARTQLDAGGRLLLMSQAVAAVRDQLTVYARPSKKAAFLEQLLATGDELKSYCVSPADLISAAEEEQGEEGERLRDLGLILSAYEGLLGERCADPRDRLTKLAETLGECRWFAGKDVYLDGFIDFTPQQRLVLARMLRQAHSVHFALTCDTPEPKGAGVFDPERKTVQELTRLCREEHIPMEYEVLTRRADEANEWLCHLEEHLFNDRARCETEGTGVMLYTAASPYAEVEWTAGQILRLVKENGWHFRDIALCARTMERYEAPLETVFHRYQIPLFFGRTEPILEKPVLTLLTSALDIVGDQYEYEDVFRYLKTGLTGVEREDIDLLENYVLSWDIRGSRWTRAEDWSWHPRGYAQRMQAGDAALLKRLNTLRRQVTAPLQKLAALRRGTGAELARNLYAFLEAIELPQRLLERSNELRANGELQQAEEYRQIWQILLQALEQCCDLLGEQTLELNYFTDLVKLVLSQYEVSAIPVSLDRVNGGELARVAHAQCKVMFVLGVDDEQFPLVTQSPGLLTDADRAFLTGRGHELAPSAERRLDREECMAYDALCRPTDLLVLTCPRAAEGALKRPAVLWNRVEQMFPNCPRGAEQTENRLLAPLPALELGAERGDEQLLARLSQRPGWEQVGAQMKQARIADRGYLSPEARKALYGEEISFSASKMDKLKSCHFSFFLEYGLQAKARKQAGFKAPETGTFIHDVLEHVLKAAKSEGGVRNLSKERRKELTQEAIERYIREELNGLEDQTPRFCYLFRRLLHSVELIVENVAEELENSLFNPMEFELGFGRGKELAPLEVSEEGVTLIVKGFIDRVDGWVKDDTLYLKIVDYKTGKKAFSLTDVWHGLSLQMLIYLFALQDQKEYFLRQEAFREVTHVVPAGVLYLPARDVLLSGSREMEPEERRKETDKALKRSGLLLWDEMVLHAMEQWGEDGPRFLPVTKTKNGIKDTEALASAEQWGRLKKRVDLLLREMGKELSRGIVTADPYWKGDHTACDFCDFAQACHFENGRGSDKCRYLYKVKGADFWEGRKEGE